jgi:hypothetical protein
MGPKHSPVWADDAIDIYVRRTIILFHFFFLSKRALEKKGNFRNQRKETDVTSAPSSLGYLPKLTSLK